jgi:hypothetical protein
MRARHAAPSYSGVGLRPEDDVEQLLGGWTSAERVGEVSGQRGIQQITHRPRLRLCNPDTTISVPRVRVRWCVCVSEWRTRSVGDVKGVRALLDLIAHGFHGCVHK